MPATIEIPTTRPNRTLTLSAFPDGSDTAALTGQSLIEATNRPGLYSYSNSTATGLHLLIAFDDSTPVWQCWAVLATDGVIVASESRNEAIYLDAAVSSRSTFNVASDKVVLHATQSDYAPAKAGDEMDFVDAPNATAVTAIQNGLATTTAIQTVDDNVDAIKAKTDNLPDSPAAVGSAMTLQDDAITAAKFDESTAFPLASQDSGATSLARTGSDSDTLETLSDQMDDLKSTAEAISVSAARRIVIQGAKQFERPGSGSVVYTIEVRTYSAFGADVNADSTPTLTAAGKSSGDLSANLGTASNPTTGVYRWDYTVEDDAAIEELLFSCSAVIDSDTFTISLITQVTDFVAETWTASDRTKLNAIHAKLPSKDYLTGTANADGDVQADDMTGNFPGSVASVAGNVGGNVTGSIGSLASQAKADVNAEADQALSDYSAAKPADIPSASTIAAAVWSNSTRTLSSFGSLVSDIASAVWSATLRTLTGFSFTPSIDSTQYNAIAKSTEIPDISGLAEKTDLPADFNTVGVTEGRIDANAEVNLTPEQLEQLGDEIGQAIAGGITVSGLSPAARQQLAGTVIRLEVPSWTVEGFDKGIISGDAYKDGREWVLSIEGYEGPDLESADQIVMQGSNCDDEFEWAFEAENLGEGLVTLTASLDSEDTDIPKGVWKVHLFAQFGADRVSLIGPNAKLKVTGV